MSAPSKEEIAPRGKEELVEWARYAIEHAHCGPECKYEPQTREQNQAMARDIVALAAENERLRAEQQRPMPWTEDEVKALIKEAVESDPNGKCLHCGGTFPKTDLYHWRDCIRHTANIELAKLRAERAECLVLLERCARDLTEADEWAREVEDGPFEEEATWSATIADVHVMRAKLKGQP